MNQPKIIECGAVNLIPAKEKDDSEYSEVIPFQETPQDPHKTGPRPKKLVAIEVQGYQVGRGIRRRVVSPKDLYELAALGCNDREIARWFDIDENTLRYNFSDILEKGREDLKHSLRRAMLKNAMNGNAALQIFLAKNILGMSDTPTNTEDKKPLPWSDE